MPKIINDPTNKILQASIDILRKVGRDDFSMRQVAKKANISVGTIYNYYPNKESLFLAIDKKQGEVLRKELGAYKAKGKKTEDALVEIYEKTEAIIALEEEASLIEESLAKAFSTCFKREGVEKEYYQIAANVLVSGIAAKRKKENLLAILNAIFA